ncbi:lysylphosphatidylglycerol synthase transmembrane domain-containing protein [Thermogemmatispora sp.]|uniref:lysylphosphatidylglycerol synthase transmembrane domain-containing protein n=1 Tax=Thermogemmatispora sp. TaxID=1968838 RepID=UPI001D60505C|nr:lysylphosphatidylglycerol synthase transmembrane domain-containing protein [Thermogemmatispora sp.]MBX5449906.1 flippase-like domain-containing protein [Thermogemmatispora sp.]
MGLLRGGGAWQLVLGTVLLMTVGGLVWRLLATSAAWSELGHSHLSYACLLLGGSGGLLCVVISAFQWYALLLAQGMRIDLAELIRLYLIGIAFGHWLPLGIGGDAIKALYCGRILGSYALAVGTLALARLLGLLALGLSLGGTLCVWGQLLPAPLGAVAAAVSLLITLVPVGLLGGARLAARQAKGGRQAEADYCPLRFRLGTRLRAALLIIAVRPGAFLPALGLSFSFWVVAALNYYGYGLALGIHLPLPCYFVTMSLAALAATLPLSLFNGLGLREGALVCILALYHVPVDKALLLAGCVGAQSLGLALSGWLVYLLRRKEEK